MQGVIRRGTYNLKYAKGFAHSQHTISAAQQQQEQEQHKHQGQQQRDSVQSTNDLFCSVFFWYFALYFGLQSSANFLLSTPSYQTANVHALVLVLPLAVVPVPVPVPVPIFIAHR